VAYVTPSDLLTWPDLDLLASLVGPTDYPAISGALLRETISGGTRSGTADEFAAADIAAVTLQTYCSDAGEQVDAALAGRYPVPLSPVPRMVSSIALDLVLYKALGFRAAAEDGPYGGLIRRGKDALAMLDKLSRGTLQLGAALVPSPQAGEPIYNAAPAMFSGPDSVYTLWGY
jgi:phage gp36-like protein